MTDENIRIPCDLHTHSSLSFDADDAPEEMIKRAIALGMDFYALTDHVEVNKFTDPEYNCDKTVSGAAAALPALREKYADRIGFIYGVELGQPLHDLALTEKILAENDYDYIIGSCHMIRGYDDFYFLDYAKNDPVFLLDVYFEELLEMAEWNGFDILAHLTYPLRYITERDGVSVDMTRYDDVIDEIFRTIIANGKGIEINSSGVKKSGIMHPGIRYIKRYRELGGTVLSIGSDAHCTENLGGGIPEAARAAKEAGFDEITCFRKRKQHRVKI